MAFRISEHRMTAGGMRLEPTPEEVREHYKRVRGWTDDMLTDEKVQQIIKMERATPADVAKMNRKAKREAESQLPTLNATIATPAVQAQVKEDRKKNFREFRMALQAARRGGNTERRAQQAARIDKAYNRIFVPDAVLDEHAKSVENAVDSKVNFTVRACSVCIKTVFDPDKTKWCACKTVRYCCKDSQRTDWPKHKAECQAARNALAASAASAAPPVAPSAPPVEEVD
jgi:hypothetical protein